MSDEPQAETVEPEHIHDRLWHDKRVKFERLFRNYLAARAAYADPDTPDDDDVRAPLSEKQDAAELALLVQPAPSPWGVWVKWEILDRLVTTDAEDGHFVENRIMTALGAIKADIIRFGLNAHG
jgi:hypothetical protein